MLDAHALIRDHGLDRARAQASTKFDRTCVDAAASILQCSARSVLYSGLSVTCLPHRRIVEADGGEAHHWQRGIGVRHYEIESGRYSDGQTVGIPFGSKGRLILLYLHDQAYRHRSPAFPVLMSKYQWIGAMSTSMGGMNYRQVGEQARRVGTCRIQITDNETSRPPSGLNRVADHLLIRRKGELLLIDPNERTLQEDAFPEGVQLNPAFYQAALEDVVPVSAEAIRLLRDNSWAMDQYIWMAYLLPKLREPTHTPWEVLKSVFGLGYKHPRLMRTSFTRALQLALCVYPEARASTDATGFWIFPSPPPVRQAG